MQCLPKDLACLNLFDGGYTKISGLTALSKSSWHSGKSDHTTWIAPDMLIDVPAEDKKTMLKKEASDSHLKSDEIFYKEQQAERTYSKKIQDAERTNIDTILKNNKRDLNFVARHAEMLNALGSESAQVPTNMPACFGKFLRHGYGKNIGSREIILDAIDHLLLVKRGMCQ